MGPVQTQKIESIQKYIGPGMRQKDDWSGLLSGKLQNYTRYPTELSEFLDQVSLESASRRYIRGKQFHPPLCYLSLLKEVA